MKKPETNGSFIPKIDLFLNAKGFHVLPPTKRKQSILFKEFLTKKIFQQRFNLKSKSKYRNSSKALKSSFGPSQAKKIQRNTQSPMSFHAKKKRSKSMNVEEEELFKKKTKEKRKYLLDLITSKVNLKLITLGSSCPFLHRQGFEEQPNQPWTRNAICDPNSFKS